MSTTAAVSSTSVCTYCSKECKSTDSRPYPNSKSQDRIHNKCRLKLAISGKKTSIQEGEVKSKALETGQKSAFNTDSIAERLAKDELELKQNTNSKKCHKPNNNPTQFFFDLTAGTVTGEKRRYLHHSKLNDYVARYDRDGFKEEAIGSSYDALGNDLTVLEDEAELALEERLPSAARAKLTNKPSLKRKHEMDTGREDEESEKRLASQKQNCWFCLFPSNAGLIIGNGKQRYLALAKGRLTDDHLLILPIEHTCSIRSDSNSQQLLQELEYFKNGLVELFGTQSKAVLFYERNVKSFHWRPQVTSITITKFDTIEDTLDRVTILQSINCTLFRLVIVISEIVFFSIGYITNTILMLVLTRTIGQQ